MKTIIAATDFSPAATNAVMYAKDMAAALGADLLLVHIWKLPIHYGDMPAVIINEEDIMQEAKKSLAGLQEKLSVETKGRIHISTKLRMGEFFHELQTICDAVKPYVVIMGSQGTTGAERIVFGGHAVHAMKHLTWPLISVPPATSFTGIKNIGLACDLVNVAETVPVNEIRLLVKDFNATLHVLNTGRHDSFKPEHVFESGVLRQMAGDINPVYHFIENEDTDQGIMDFAAKNKLDLLVVLPKRHGLIDNLVHKSHTKQIVLHSHVPVLALHE